MATTADETATIDAGRRAQLLREMAPVGLLQTFLVGRIAAGMGRLERLDAREDLENPGWVRERARAERSFYRALTEFHRRVKLDARRPQAVAPSAAAEPQTVGPATKVEPEARPSRRKRLEVADIVSIARGEWSEGRVLEQFPTLSAEELAEYGGAQGPGPS